MRWPHQGGDGELAGDLSLRPADLERPDLDPKLGVKIHVDGEVPHGLLLPELRERADGAEEVEERSVRRRPVSESGRTRSSVLPWATAISCEETDPDPEAVDFFESRTPPPPAEGAAAIGEDLAASSPAAGAELPQAAQDGMKRKERFHAVTNV